jgi:hypothetical protein
VVCRLERDDHAATERHSSSAPAQAADLSSGMSSCLTYTYLGRRGAGASGSRHNSDILLDASDAMERLSEQSCCAEEAVKERIR